MFRKSQKEIVKDLFSLVANDLLLVDEVIQTAAEVSYEPLRRILKPILAAKGKQLRPALLLMAARQNQYRLDCLIPAAAAIELLHTSTLVHDDMIDRASTRRGVATVNSSLGDKVSVLVGDYLFAKSSDLAAQTNSVNVMRAFSETLMIIADGQLQEIFVPATAETLRTDYLRRIEAKTASLFRTSTTVGALLSGARSEHVEALRDFGYYYGMAFQIVDDILDFAGDETELGKPVGSDLRQGTITLPAIHLLHIVEEDNPIETIMAGNGYSEEDVLRAIDLVNDKGALDLSYEDARSYVERAKQALHTLPDNPYHQAMRGLADVLMQS